MLVPLLLAIFPLAARQWVIVVVAVVAMVVAVQSLEGLPWLLLTCRCIDLLLDCVHLLSPLCPFIRDLLVACIHICRRRPIRMLLEYVHLLLQCTVHLSVSDPFFPGKTVLVVALIVTAVIFILYEWRRFVIFIICLPIWRETCVGRLLGRCFLVYHGASVFSL